MSECAFKIIIVGDEESGKTSFMKRHINDVFQEEYTPTLGYENYTVSIKYRKKYNFMFWDLAGKEENKGLYDGYMIGADACIIMFDINNFDVTKIIKTVYNVKRVTENLTYVLVANKMDLFNTTENKRSTNRKLDYLKRGIKRICENYSYCEISCKNNYNMERPFSCLVSSLIKSKIPIRTYQLNDKKVIAE